MCNSWVSCWPGVQVCVVEVHKNLPFLFFLPSSFLFLFFNNVIIKTHITVVFLSILERVIFVVNFLMLHLTRIENKESQKYFLY